jgi:class 3 adenylate cyclase
MGSNNDNSWMEAALYGTSSPTNLNNLLNPTFPVPVLKSIQPSATTFSNLRKVGERFDKRLAKVLAVLPVGKGRVAPDDDDLAIGDARRLRLSVLFLDICKFSQIPSFVTDDDDSVLKLLNLFMAEMLFVVREHGGVFEKNTGDGLMAYFDVGSESDCTQRAVDAAVTMHYYNDQVLTPRLEEIGLPEMKFRLGIETGLVTIGNVGVRGDHHSLVAIGNVPNIACKLMNLLPDGGIALGSYTHSLLAAEWQAQTTSLGTLPGYVFKGTQNPYQAYALTYRVPPVRDWLFTTSEMLGGTISK